MNSINFYKKVDNLIIEKMDNAYLVMNALDDSSKGIYISNTAVDIFNLCDGHHKSNDIVEVLMDEFDVGFDLCQRDVDNCLSSFISAGIITTVI